MKWFKRFLFQTLIPYTAMSCTSNIEYMHILKFAMMKSAVLISLFQQEIQFYNDDDDWIVAYWRRSGLYDSVYGCQIYWRIEACEIIVDA